MEYNEPDACAQALTDSADVLTELYQRSAAGDGSSPDGSSVSRAVYLRLTSVLIDEGHVSAGDVSRAFDTVQSLERFVPRHAPAASFTAPHSSWCRQVHPQLRGLSLQGFMASMANLATSSSRSFHHPADSLRVILAALHHASGSIATVRRPERRGSSSSRPRVVDIGPPVVSLNVDDIMRSTPSTAASPSSSMHRMAEHAPAGIGRVSIASQRSRRPSVRSTATAPPAVPAPAPPAPAPRPAPAVNRTRAQKRPEAEIRPDPPPAVTVAVAPIVVPVYTPAQTRTVDAAYTHVSTRRAGREDSAALQRIALAQRLEAEERARSGVVPASDAPTPDPLVAALAARRQALKSQTHENQQRARAPSVSYVTTPPAAVVSEPPASHATAGSVRSISRRSSIASRSRAGSVATAAAVGNVRERMRRASVGAASVTGSSSVSHASPSVPQYAAPAEAPRPANAFTIPRSLLARAEAIHAHAAEDVLQALFARYCVYGMREKFVSNGGDAAPRMSSTAFHKLMLDACVISKYIANADVDVVFKSACARSAGVGTAPTQASLWSVNTYTHRGIIRSMLYVGIDYYTFTHALLSLAVARYVKPRAHFAADAAPLQPTTSAASMASALFTDDAHMSDVPVEEDVVDTRSLSPAIALRLMLHTHIFPLAIRLGLLTSLDDVYVDSTTPPRPVEVAVAPPQPSHVEPEPEQRHDEAVSNEVVPVPVAEVAVEPEVDVVAEPTQRMEPIAIATPMPPVAAPAAVIAELPILNLEAVPEQRIIAPTPASFPQQLSITHSGARALRMRLENVAAAARAHTLSQPLPDSSRPQQRSDVIPIVTLVAPAAHTHPRERLQAWEQDSLDEEAAEHGMDDDAQPGALMITTHTQGARSVVHQPHSGTRHAPTYMRRFGDTGSRAGTWSQAELLPRTRAVPVHAAAVTTREVQSYQQSEIDDYVPHTAAMEAHLRTPSPTQSRAPASPHARAAPAPPLVDAFSHVSSPPSHHAVTASVTSPVAAVAQHTFQSPPPSSHARDAVALSVNAAAAVTVEPHVSDALTPPPQRAESHSMSPTAAAADDHHTPAAARATGRGDMHIPTTDAKQRMWQRRFETVPEEDTQAASRTHSSIAEDSNVSFTSLLRESEAAGDGGGVDDTIHNAQTRSAAVNARAAPAPVAAAVTSSDTAAPTMMRIRVHAHGVDIQTDAKGDAASATGSASHSVDIHSKLPHQLPQLQNDADVVGTPRVSGGPPLLSSRPSKVAPASTSTASDIRAGEGSSVVTHMRVHRSGSIDISTSTRAAQAATQSHVSAESAVADEVTGASAAAATPRDVATAVPALLPTLMPISAVPAASAHPSTDGLLNLSIIANDDDNSVRAGADTPCMPAAAAPSLAMYAPPDAFSVRNSDVSTVYRRMREPHAPHAVIPQPAALPPPRPSSAAAVTRARALETITHAPAEERERGASTSRGRLHSRVSELESAPTRTSPARTAVIPPPYMRASTQQMMRLQASEAARHATVRRTTTQAPPTPPALTVLLSPTVPRAADTTVEVRVTHDAPAAMPTSATAVPSPMPSLAALLAPPLTRTTKPTQSYIPRDAAMPAPAPVNDGSRRYERATAASVSRAAAIAAASPPRASTASTSAAVAAAVTSGLTALAVGQARSSTGRHADRVDSPVRMTAPTAAAAQLLAPPLPVYGGVKTAISDAATARRRALASPHRAAR